MLLSNMIINSKTGRHNRSTGQFHKYFADRYNHSILEQMVSFWQKEITTFQMLRVTDFQLLATGVIMLQFITRTFSSFQIIFIKTHFCYQMEFYLFFRLLLTSLTLHYKHLIHMPPPITKLCSFISTIIRLPFFSNPLLLL